MNLFDWLTFFRKEFIISMIWNKNHFKRLWICPNLFINCRIYLKINFFCCPKSLIKCHHSLINSVLWEISLKSISLQFLRDHSQVVESNPIWMTKTQIENLEKQKSEISVTLDDFVLSSRWLQCLILIVSLQFTREINPSDIQISTFYWSRDLKFFSYSIVSLIGFLIFFLDFDLIKKRCKIVLVGAKFNFILLSLSFWPWDFSFLGPSLFPSLNMRLPRENSFFFEIKDDGNFWKLEFSLLLECFRNFENIVKDPELLTCRKKINLSKVSLSKVILLLLTLNYSNNFLKNNWQVSRIILNNIVKDVSNLK